MDAAEKFYRDNSDLCLGGWAALKVTLLRSRAFSKLRGKHFHVDIGKSYGGRRYGICSQHALLERLHQCTEDPEPVVVKGHRQLSRALVIANEALKGDTVGGTKRMAELNRLMIRSGGERHDTWLKDYNEWKAAATSASRLKAS